MLCHRALLVVILNPACPPAALLEEPTSSQHDSRDFSFADFQELVKDAPTWEALEAALQS